MHEVINERSSSAPIFFDANSIETSPIGAEKNCSAPIEKNSWGILHYSILLHFRKSAKFNFSPPIRLALNNSSAPIGLVWNERRTKLLFSANRRAVKIVPRQSDWRWKICQRQSERFQTNSNGKNRRWGTIFVNYFVHTHLSTLKPIRAALTSQDLSSDTKFGPSQSRVTLPLTYLRENEKGILRT